VGENRKTGRDIALNADEQGRFQLKGFAGEKYWLEALGETQGGKMISLNFIRRE
jgi:hypothetical protein